MALIASCTASHSASRVPEPEGLPAPADLVLLRGEGVGSGGGDATSVACRDGRIVYVGSDRRARDWVGPKTRVFTVGGAALVAGLTDAHAHLLGLGESLVRVDLVGATSYAQVIDRTTARAPATARGSWILGRGWDQNRWPEKSFPTHVALSARTPGHPVFLTRIDGHAGIANARAMEIAGVKRDTPDPEGGRILRDPATGDPTGVFVDNGMALVERVIPKPSHEEKRELLDRAMQECAANGLTEVHDAGVDLDTIRCYRELCSKGRMSVRVYAMLSGPDSTLSEYLAHGSEPIDRYLSHGPEIAAEGGLLTVRTLKLYADGALGSRGAALLEPYADDPANRGLLVNEPEAIHELTVRCLRAGLQVCVHAIGDRGNRLVLDAYEKALAEVPSKDARLRIEHAQVLAPEDISRMAKLGVIASMQPTHATSDMPWAEARLGALRARGAYAWRSVLQAKGRLAFGSDFPVEAVSPLRGIYAAITRQDAEGKPEGGWFPDQRLTPAEALAGFTTGAAYAAFEEADRGSLEVGKRADITVLSVNPLTASPREILNARVIATVVGGKVVHGSPAGTPMK